MHTRHYRQRLVAIMPHASTTKTVMRLCICRPADNSRRTIIIDAQLPVLCLLAAVHMQPC